MRLSRSTQAVIITVIVGFLAMVLWSPWVGVIVTIAFAMGERSARNNGPLRIRQERDEYGSKEAS